MYTRKQAIINKKLPIVGRILFASISKSRTHIICTSCFENRRDRNYQQNTPPDVAKYLHILRPNLLNFPA